MSELMTKAVIEMPFDMAMGDELSRLQFHGRAQALLTDYARLEQECERLRAELENAYKQVNSECQDWAREYEKRIKAVGEREIFAGLLREIAVGISKREMPTEQQLNEWFDRIDAALSPKP